jgi:hypothetical protein
VVRKIQLADYKLAAIKIHLDGVAFFRAALEQKSSAKAQAEYYQILESAMTRIEELVNGKSTD